MSYHFSAQYKMYEILIIMFKRSFCLPSLRLEDMYVYCKHAVFETGSTTVDF